MKKRLRKKKHYSEFAEWGRQMIIIRNQKDEFDEFLDAFILEAIEGNGCYCGGGGKEDKLDVVVELGCRIDDIASKLKRITAWLDSRPDVKHYRIGELFDIWHSNFKDMEDIIEQASPADAGYGPRR
jgi:uncharacterized protein YggL (DUF469 family)